MFYHVKCHETGRQRLSFALLKTTFDNYKKYRRVINDLTSILADDVNALFQ